MALIKGSQLASVGKLFELGQQAMRAATDLDVENVSQVLGVNDIVRRSNSGGSGNATGWFSSVMENVHSGSGDLDSVADPYAPGALLVAGGGYPALVPETLDVWLLRITGQRSGGTAAAFGTGQVFLRDPTTSVGFSVDDSGSVAGAQATRTVARWTKIDGLLDVEPLLGPNDEFCFDVNQRVRRGTTFNFQTSCTGACEIRAILVLGLFPAGLGQDVAV